ncbi:MAG: hypothetical protein AMS22_04325 [Thiotrichales bacterium SG8_50]|nr:MAG: hypothetical protein AMS22_04325 [Thiotrichales bacterium SG8_50]
MRKQMLEALAYPRDLIRSGLDVDNCPHSGNYAAEDIECLTCFDGPECRWLYHNDEFVALEGKSLAELADALEFALEHVSAQVIHSSHNQRTCRCDACAWLRKSQKLLDRAVNELAQGRTSVQVASA